MENFKSFLASKTIWGGLIAALSMLAQMFGFNVTAADQASIAELIVEFAGLVGAALAIYGRVVATKQIGSK